MQTRRLAVTGVLSLAALSLAALTVGRGKEPPAAPPPQAVTVAEVPAAGDRRMGRVHRPARGGGPGGDPPPGLRLHQAGHLR